MAPSLSNASPASTALGNNGGENHERALSGGQYGIGSNRGRGGQGRGSHNTAGNGTRGKNKATASCCLPRQSAEAIVLSCLKTAEMKKAAEDKRKSIATTKKGKRTPNATERQSNR